MDRGILGAIWILVAAGAAPAADLAADVRAVFAAKCAGCHGTGVVRLKGRFGYVTDLARVAANREMVVPGAPDESELWELVRRGEMPPAESPAGPLTAAEKESVRAWIADGAPTATEPSPSPPTAPSTSATAALRRLGRLHVVVVHFPIALFIAAAMCEAWSVWHGRWTSTPAVRFCVSLGAAGAVAAAALGWLHAWGGAGAGMPTVLGWHRWLGTATAVSAVFTAALATDRRRGVGFRISLLVSAILVAATGHFGGVLVYGGDFFTAP